MASRNMILFFYLLLPFYLFCEENLPESSEKEISTLLKNNQISKGLEVCKKLINEGCQDIELYHKMGCLHKRCGNLKEAEVCLYKCLENSPKNSDYLFSYGQICKEQNQLEEAKKAFQRALLESPHYSDIWYSLSSVYFDQQKFRQAADLADHAYQLDPKNIDYLPTCYQVRRLTSLNLGSHFIYAQEKEKDLTLKVYTVKRQFFQETLSLEKPCFEHCRIVGLIAYGKDKEHNLIVKKNNFDVVLYNIGSSLELFLCPNWVFHTICQMKSAHNDKKAIYTFKDKTIFEPGIDLTYESASHFLFMQVAMDSFVTKDFKRLRSKLMRINHAEVIYQYQWCHQGGRVAFQYELNRYHDKRSNLGRHGYFWVDLPFPRYNPYFYTKYQFLYGSFKDVKTGYYSYRDRKTNEIWFGVKREISPGHLLEIITILGWTQFISLNQADIFSPKIKNLKTFEKHFHIRWYRIINPRCRLQLEGSYFKNSKDYHSWTGSFQLNISF